MIRTAAFFVLSTLALTSGAAAQTRRPASPSPRPTPGLLIAPTALKALKAREIGPAVMGGRVSDIALDPADPHTFYVALATGGLMKTTDNGGSFKGAFEHEAVASTGAVAVAPSNPKVVWLGTGEANDRNSSGWGNGVYRSTDAGESWTRAGLPASKAIARIVVHPTDAETAWVAAAGDLWTPSSERGIYKTTDGGKTWKAVLVAPAPYGDRVGGGDLVLDPRDPQVLYAALYARRRTPWSFTAGPPATDGKDLGGIFKSTDGGTTWRKLAGGLPAGTGRIGLAVHVKDPRVVYAIVQSEEAGGTIDDVRSRRGGVFRSEDGGESWTRTSPLNPRPFYFSKIRVDPANDKRVYVLGFALHVSDDGGRSFREDLFEKVHPDTHALAIDPRDPRASAARHGRRRVPELQGGRRLGASQPDGRRRVLSHQRRHPDAVPHLRRPAGQPELGGTEPYEHEGRHRRTRTGSPSGAATASTARSTRPIRRSSTRSRSRGTCSAWTSATGR